MKPAAVEKAESLYRFAKTQGALLSTFQVILSVTEAAELLEWYAREYAGNPEFDLDVELARRSGNPWPVLENFRLMGFDMAPAAQVLN